MAKQSVVKHCLRLNLQNEQHQRIQEVLDGLNKDIHKSTNQFIIKAIDFYLQSFEKDDIMDGSQEKNRPAYVTVEELARMRKEIESSMKDELIRLMGLAFSGGLSMRVQAESRESVQTESAEDEDPYAAEVASRWG